MGASYSIRLDHSTMSNVPATIPARPERAGKHKIAVRPAKRAEPMA